VYTVQALAVSRATISQVEEMTRGQRINPLWSKLRTGRLTASNFGAVLSAANRKSYPESLFRRILGEYCLDGVKAVQWGIDNESTALAAYEAQFSTTLVAAGLVLHESGVLAASPDGFEGEDALVEVKCPYTFRASTIPDLLNSEKSFIVQNNIGDYVLKPGHDYYHQCQGQMCLTGRTQMNLFVWLPSGSLRLQLHKDEKWADEFLPILVDFAFHRLLPAFYSRLQN
jgi:YqaJ-like viral recombinase domain